MSGWVVIAAALLGVLFTLASAFGAYAVYRVNKQATALTEYKSNADAAEQNARIWQGRAQATQAELDATVRNLESAGQQITKLQTEVANLQGVVTAREEVRQLVAAVGVLTAAVADNQKVLLAAIGRSTK
jgi:uncharacterized protein HemX